jgi:hypothetical protein
VVVAEKQRLLAAQAFVECYHMQLVHHAGEHLYQPVAMPQQLGHVPIRCVQHADPYPHSHLRTLFLLLLVELFGFFAVRQPSFAQFPVSLSKKAICWKPG